MFVQYMINDIFDQIEDSDYSDGVRIGVVGIFRNLIMKKS